MLYTVLRFLKIGFFKDRHPKNVQHRHNTRCEIHMNGIYRFIVLAFLQGIKFDNKDVRVVLLKLVST